MALIQCPECQRQISDKAAGCPHCGYPISGSDEYARGLAPSAIRVPVRTEKRASKETARVRTGCGSWIVAGIMAFGLLAFISSLLEKPNLNFCSGDWHKCSDNADLVNHYKKISDVQFECSWEAGKQAKYGTPEWPLERFGTYLIGEDYPKTGTIILIEKDAQFSNGFGAMVHSTARCTYDLNQKKVLDVIVTPN